MENNTTSSMDAQSASRSTTKFTYSSSVTLSKTVAAALAALLLLLLVLTITVPILVYYYATCSKTDVASNIVTASPLSTQSPEGVTDTSGGFVTRKNYRLPRNVIPIQYKVHLKTYIPSDYVTYEPNLNFTFDGNISIVVLCNDTTDVIVLHSKKLNITKDSLRIYRFDNVTNRDLGEPIDIDVNSIKVVEDLEQYRIPLRQPLNSSTLYRMHVLYRGELNPDLSGFYRSSYEENGVTKWLAVTQFQPTSARRALPCFDEPDFKAKFIVELTHPKNMVALSNAMDWNVEDLPDGWRTTYFKASPLMSSYLLAFVVSEFLYKNSTTQRGVKFRIWARPSQIEFTSLAVDSGPKLLDFFESYFNLSFPLEKQDMVAIPDFDAGAMENWGLITYRETYLLADYHSSSATVKQRMIEIMAHELAHQWFGNLVTMDWWDDIWLNEGFSMFMQYMSTDHIANKRVKMDEQFIVSALHAAMEKDQITTSHPLHVDVNNPTEIFQIFDQITYDKGSAIVRMLVDLVSDTVFQIAIGQYLKNFQYKNANHYDLYDSLTKFVQSQGTVTDWENRPLNVTQFMPCWTEQMGYPLVTVSRNLTDGSVRLSQSRFKMDENATDNPKYLNNPFDYKWYIPLRYRLGPQTYTNMTWLVPDQTLELERKVDPNSWVIINHGVPGYFRVNYDINNWQLLLNQLKSNHEAIDVRNRAQLISDAFTLAKIGKLQYEIALNLTSYMPAELSYIAWGTCLTSLKWIKELLKKQDIEILEKYFRILVEPAYHRIGYESKLDTASRTDDDIVNHKLRTLIWQYACDNNLPHCINMSLALFKAYKENCAVRKSSSSCNVLSPNLRQVVYCTGIAHSTQPVEDWNFLWEKYLIEDFSVEKLQMLMGLSCSRNQAVLKKFLDNVVQGIGIRSADVGVAFVMVSQNPVGMNMLWEYVKNDWDKLFAKFDNSYSLGTLVNSATVGFSTEENYNELKQFTTENKNKLGSSKSAFDQQLEETRNNVIWRKNYYSSVMSWLKQNTPSVDI